MDFRARVVNLRAANCDLVALSSITRDTNQIVGAARKLGWKPDMIGSAAVYDNAVADVPGNAKLLKATEPQK